VIGRRRAVVAGGIVILLVVTGALAARATGHDTAAPRSNSNANSRRAATTTTVVPTTTVPPTTTTIDPGSLPQTEAFPSTTDPGFNARMGALWDAVVTGSVQPALPAFFPEAAYVALKAEPYAAGDYTGRLVAECGQDVLAAHALLGGGTGAATLVGVNVDSAYGHWVPPGTCYNDVGYFEVPNARMVYSVDGQVHSFGIASMISWRGAWYVVHLGSVLRSGSGGEVDSPQSGPGTSAYSSTC
jgi:hypothetical protein